ncbi:hypothetical protein ABPG74_010825 [Tetrahymena malaccensis]
MLAKKLALARSQGKPDPFKKDEFPLLQHIAVEVVSQNYILYPDLKGVPENVRDTIISKITTDLDILTMAPNIDQESFWQRACKNRWEKSQKSINIEEHGRSWKVAYLERYMEEFLTNIQNADDPNKKQILQAELKAAASWIHTLNLQNINQNIDIDFICKYLPLLTSLTLTYGTKYSGMDYNKQSVGMKLSEAANLGEAIKNCYSLLSLNISANMIDDDLLRFIMAGVNMNISLIELNLSHNKIEDQGARRIAKFLMRNEILLYLNLGNNLIGYEGSRYLAQALKVNKNLQSLNLKLNNLGDKAGKKLFQDLMLNKTLLELDVSGNQFEFETALKLSDYVADSMCGLKVLNIANNDFNDSCYENLKTGFTKNYSLAKLDIRGNKFSKTQEEKEQELKDPFRMFTLSQTEKELTQIIIRHDLTAQKIQFFSESDLDKIKQLKELQGTKQEPEKVIQQDQNKE